MNFRHQPQLSHPIFQHCVCTFPRPMNHHLSVKPNILYMLQAVSQMFVLSLCKSRPRMERRKRRSDIHILLCTTMLRKYFWGSASCLLSILSIVVFLLTGVMYDDGDWKQNKQTTDLWKARSISTGGQHGKVVRTLSIVSRGCTCRFQSKSHAERPPILLYHPLKVMDSVSSPLSEIYNKYKK